MKKSARLVLAAAVLLSVGTMPAFATVSGPAPHPGISTFNLALTAILSVLGL